ncbi:PA2169 family four-helix-bundle protein [Pseudorhodoferax sp. Leaf267]|uniref:PA2169 family four-helix-bundle protein n=1 Tax=Pseudorhodoferax sp. Leaf267 TaxID=1736316 RepID=UPI0006F577AE|nr:PA2169 family four-helix-bundle protein [Pseudorhodoferax sp. Leaf267]KQP23005.1 hypothetical protein ASF43_03710 [Pseudorhodoferax sp. Leaf267]
MAAAEERHQNLDPITDAPGAHPVGTGVGAAGGGMAGAAIGAVGGPVGAAVGLVAGAVVGGLTGKTVAERVNPTAEEAYWRENYTREPYYEAGRTYDDYAPAYAYGWSTRSAYTGGFDLAEADLAREWEGRRGASSLDWEQARPATRAAWDRVDTTYGGGGAFDAEPVSYGDALDALDDLLKTARDGEKGFKESAEHTKTSTLAQTFLQRSRECARAAEELAAAITQLGGKVNDGGSATGALHRGWVSLRGSVGALSDLAMLEECERGEDTALARYRKALKQDLPADIRAMVQRQLEGAQRNHDQIKQLRDAERARA